MRDENCAQCHKKPATPIAHSYFRREFCSEACLAEFQRPEAGKAATYNIGSDYYPYTIVAVSPSGHKVTVRADRIRRPGLMLPAADEEVEYAHRTKTGVYRMKRCGRLYIGVRHHELDPGF
jgi:hypothetical protein